MLVPESRLDVGAPVISEPSRLPRVPAGLKHVLLLVVAHSLTPSLPHCPRSLTICSVQCK